MIPFERAMVFCMYLSTASLFGIFLCLLILVSR